MVEKEATVVPEQGLHARPAAQFVKTAKGFGSDIKVIKGDTEVNAKSSLNLMTLGATQGDKLTIRADGEDEEEAAEALVELLAQEEV